MATGLDALADLDLPPRDDAVDRRAKDRALEIDSGLRKRGSGGENFRVVVDRRVGDQRAVGIAIADGGVAGRCCLRPGRLSGAQAGRGRVERIAGRRQFIARNRARGGELLAPLQIDASLFDVGLC